MFKILVVEDDMDIQEVLENLLCGSGYEVTLASDGVEAISLFTQKKYDLVLLDILLPKIDEYGVCELIRKQSPIPIVMLTALDNILSIDGRAEMFRSFLVLIFLR